MYTLDAVDDIRAAVEYLVELGAGLIITVGTCNGAYLTFHALCQDHRIAGAVLVNLYCFDWYIKHDGVPFGATPARSTATYVALLKRSESWRRVLRGQIPVLTIIIGLARCYLNRAAQWVKGVFGTSASIQTISSRIEDLRRRGARLFFIYSAGDIGLADVRLHLGSLEHAASIIGEPVRIVSGADHSFSSKKAQFEIFEAICKLLNIEDSEIYANNRVYTNQDC